MDYYGCSIISNRPEFVNCLVHNKDLPLHMLRRHSHPQRASNQEWIRSHQHVISCLIMWKSQRKCPVFVSVILLLLFWEWPTKWEVCYWHILDVFLYNNTIQSHLHMTLAFNFPWIGIAVLKHFILILGKENVLKIFSNYICY